MKIKTIETQTRRDFMAIYECEHCGAEVERSGYDDNHFHEHVIPGMTCKSCGKVGGQNYTPLTPKYPEGMVV